MFCPWPQIEGNYVHGLKQKEIMFHYILTHFMHCIHFTDLIKLLIYWRFLYRLKLEKYNDWLNLLSCDCN